MNITRENLQGNQGIPLIGFGRIAHWPRLRDFLGLGLFQAAFYFAYRYGMALSPSLSAPFWFPDTVLLTALLLTHPKHWWVLLLSTLPIRLLVAVPPAAPSWFLLATFANDSLKAAAGAWLVRRYIPDLSQLGRLRESGRFVLIAVLLMPALSALVGAACRRFLGYEFWTAWLQWFLGDSLTNLVLTFAVLHWLIFFARWSGPFSRLRVLEGGLLALGLGVTAFRAFGGDVDAVENSPMLIYAPVPFLLWAAVRFGPRGAASALTLVACVSIWAATHGRGPFASHSVAKNVLEIQLFLFVVSVPMLFLAAVSEDRARVGEELRLSDERYREVVESQAELVCRYRADTTLTFVNEAYCRFFGRKREDLLGKRFLALIPAEAQPSALATVRRVIEEGRPISNEHEVLRPDGSIGWMQWDDYPILDEHGELEELQGIGRDITERRRAQDALQQSEEKFARAFHASPSAISINREQSGEIVDVNEGWQELFGIRREDALGCTLLELKIFATTEGREHFHRLLDDRRAFRNQELQLCRNNGENRWVSVSWEPINLGGEPCFLSIIQDITERKQMEEARQNLAHAMRLALVGELTASIAHEINQPLGAILNNAEAAEMLLGGPQPPLEELRAILGDIRRDDLRASAVIQRVRALIGQRRVDNRPFDINAVITDVLRLVALDAGCRGVVLVSELAEKLPTIHGDSVQIQQVLLNLILNGMDAMGDTPAVRRQLVVRSTNAGVRSVEVSVADAGHGIPPDKLPRIFESFFTTKEHGMGLGLAMVRSIIELHRGRITAENNADGGATFCFSLPVDGTPLPDPVR